MTKSLQNPTLRAYPESNSPEQLTKKLSQHTLGIEILLTRTKHELSDTSLDGTDTKSVQIKYFPLPSCDLHMASLTAEATEKRID